MSDIDVGSLFATDETKTIYLAPASAAHPKGIWVTLKRQLDYGEKVAVEAAKPTKSAPPARLPPMSPSSFNRSAPRRNVSLPRWASSPTQAPSWRRTGSLTQPKLRPALLR